MRIHEIIIVPAAGHAGQGTYSRGHTLKTLAEVDIVDGYLKRLLDELDISSVRHRVMPTRRAPGVPETERYTLKNDHALHLTCAVGWDTSKSQRCETNISMVSFGPDVPQKLAAGLVEVLGQWGSLYVHGHRRANAYQTDVPGLRVEPFRLNGPHAMQYASKLDQLGRDIGRFIADWCIEKNTGTTIRAPSLLRRV